MRSAWRLELVSERIIAAPPAAVWATLVDAASWPRWCGPVAAVHEVPARWEPGEGLAYTLSMGPGVPVGFHVTLVEVQPERSLRWTATKWWGVRGSRSFHLDPVDGGTRVRDDKVFESRLWPVGWLYPRATVRRMSERWLADLDGEVAARIREA